MAKFLPDAIIDGMLAYIQVRATRVNVNSTQPTTYAEATSTYKLAQSGSALTSTNFTVGNGDTSGRKLSVPAQSSLTIDTTGTAAHVALTGSSGSALLLVTTCTTIALTTGNTVNVPTWDFEIRDVA